MLKFIVLLLASGGFAVGAPEIEYSWGCKMDQAFECSSGAVCRPIASIGVLTIAPKQSVYSLCETADYKTCAGGDATFYAAGAVLYGRSASGAIFRATRDRKVEMDIGTKSGLIVATGKCEEAPPFITPPH